jgi:hypothetical protein
MKIDLNKIVEGMEFQNEDSEVYLKRTTGEIVMLGREEIDAAEDDENATDYPEWQQPLIETAKEIYVEDSPDYLRLPDRFEIDEYRMMADFVETVDNPDHQQQLARSIRGSGAFRRFKDTAEELDLLESWFAYRDGEYRRLAMEWCQKKGIEFE